VTERSHTRFQGSSAKAAGLFGVSSMVLAVALATPMLFDPGRAFAADAAPAAAAANPDQSTVNEVVVTAQFRAQSLQKTPLAITAETGAALEARGQSSVDQVTNEAPNVTMKPGPEPFGPAMQTFIRGIGQGDFEPTYSPGVGMYIDDVYYGSITGTDFKLLDLDRIEIARGPQGTLNGQNSIGGSVKLYTKQADGNDGGYLSLGYGSYNQIETKGAADFTIIPDQLFVRISGYGEQQGGYVTRYDYGCTHPGSGVPSLVTGPGCVLGTEGGTSTGAGRVSVVWTPNNKLDVHLSADTSQDSSEASALTLLYVGSTSAEGIASLNPAKSFAGPVPFGTSNGSAFITKSSLEPSLDTFTHSPYASYASFCDSNPDSGTQAYCVPAMQHFNGYGASAVIDYRFTDHVAIKSLTSYRTFSATWSDDEDASPVSDQLLSNHNDLTQFSEELRLNGDALDGTVHWTVGGFYYKDRAHYTGRIDLAVFDFLENDTIPSSTSAGFANVDWNATDKLEVTAGVRYTEQEKTFVFGRLGIPGTAAGPPPHFGFIVPYIGCNGPGTVPLAAAVCGLNGNTQEFTGSHVDYRFAVQYQWTPDFMTYASTATGFKGGGISPRPFIPAQEVPFGPEVDTAYEIGIKSDWFDRKVRFNGDVFYTVYSDIQLTVGSCPQFGPAPGCAVTLNAGNATTSGVELELEAHPTRALSIDASFSTLDFNFTSLNPEAIASGITKSMKAPFTPPWKFDIGIQYAFTFGSAGTLTPRLDYTDADSFHAAIPNDVFNTVPGYPLLNAGVTWRAADGKWQAQLQINNVTNQLYYLGIFDNRGAENAVVAEPGAPREWELTVKRTF
jgi:iron complex outermembrane receptor protein